MEAYFFKAGKIYLIEFVYMVRIQTLQMGKILLLMTKIQMLQMVKIQGLVQLTEMIQIIERVQFPE